MSNIDPALIDVVMPEHSGYPPDKAAEDTRDALMMAAGDAARAFPDSWWIEPSDWPDAIRDNDKYGTWALNYLDRYTNQNPTHECTSHSLRALAESARNVQRGIQVGPPIPKQRLPISADSASVWLSCLSIYAEANPREWGGASVRGVMEIAVRRGFLPDKIQPRDYRFQHDLQGTCGTGGINQSSGDWVAVKNFPDGWKDTAKHFRVLEVIFPETWEQAVCCVLHGRGVGVGRSGHAVPWMRLMPSGEMLYTDSYDRILYDSVRTQKSAYRGSFCIVTMNVPDDWDKPAG